MIYSHKGECTCFLRDVPVIVKYEAYHQDAKTTGPWEDCYPEDSDMSILSVTKDGKEIEVDEATLDRFAESCWEDFWEEVGANEEAEYYAELNRGYAQDRI